MATQSLDLHGEIGAGNEARTRDLNLGKAFSALFHAPQQFSNLASPAHETLCFPAIRDHYSKLPFAMLCYGCILYLHL